MLDRGFLSLEPTVRLVLFAAAVEVLLAREGERPLRVAARVVYLTCGNGCANTRPACPYVVGFDSRKHLLAVVKQWSEAGTQWACSAFLDIARAPELDPHFRRAALFGARNEAVHEGRTSLDDSDITWLRSYADGAVLAAMAWFAAHPGATVADLDAEIAAGVSTHGVMSAE